MEKDGLSLYKLGQALYKQRSHHIFKEANRYILDYKKIPDNIYHYCSMDVAISILKNKEFWLFPTEKMNDTTETIYIDELINSHIQELQSQHSTGLLEDILDFTALHKSERRFCSCFSEKRDLLSQWRAYADMGKGVSIGIHSESLNLLSGFPIEIDRFQPEERISLIPMIYDEYRQKEIIEKHLAKTLEEKNPLYAMVMSDFARLFKHPAFKEEVEWRINHHCLQENDVLTDCFTKEVQYINKVTQGLTPYLIWPFDSNKNLFIKDCPIIEITLGPENKTNIGDMKMFIKDLGYENVNITKSTIPYRN